MALTEAAEKAIGVQGGDPEIWRRYIPAPGRLVVVRDRIDTTGEGEYVASKVVDWRGREVQILGTSERAEINQAFEPWATVLMIGDPRRTDFGTTINPPKVKEGQRILISPTGGRDVVISHGLMKMTLTIIPFEGVVLIDRGPNASA